MTLKPLGDRAWLAYLPDETAAAGLAAAAKAANPPWLEDVVPAYAAVGVYFDPDRVPADDVAKWVRGLSYSSAVGVGKTHTIPVCYEMQLDLARVAELCGSTPDQVIDLHRGTEYTVYAIGFVLGFPYLGYLPEKLCGVPRLASPRPRVEAGTVGLTGKQTGVYP